MGEASRKEGACGAMVSRNWVEGGRNHFRGMGKLKGDCLIKVRQTLVRNLENDQFRPRTASNVRVSILEAAAV